MAPGTLTLIFKVVPSDCTTAMTSLENCTPEGNNTSTPWHCHKLSSLKDALKCTGNHSSCLLPDTGSLSSLGGRLNSASLGFVFGVAPLIHGPKLSNLGVTFPNLLKPSSIMADLIMAAIGACSAKPFTTVDVIITNRTLYTTTNVFTYMLPPQLYLSC